ncbi:PDZ domain [Trypanosoma melophagium]|uniref:PDZ domain n=1 Tax=Trypanosoma melophagium TaxID=715481 RepID=UPI00351A8097|nr:PDZ domain [Trypanosoma melophagium]
MLFTVQPSSGDADVTLDGLATTGNTLTQLHNFFEHHTFDTAGPYSDLFSVLLSCCKQLVDTNLHHHTVLVNQQREVNRLSSETEALCDLTARCQERIRDLNALPLEGNIDNSTHPATETATVNGDDLICLRERMDEAYKRLEKTEATVVDVYRLQDELKQQDFEEQRRSHAVEERVRQLEEDVTKLSRGISAHAEYVDGEITAIKTAVGSISAADPVSSSAERLLEFKLYTDNKVEALRDELCRALQESGLNEEIENTNISTSQSPRNLSHITAAKHKNPNDSNDSIRNNDLIPSLRRFALQTSKTIPDKIEQMESRLECLEVYAPHYCALSARPPLLGVELRDEKGSGIRVDKVFQGLAAERIGIMPGDTIIAVNGQEVLTRAEMYAVMMELAREHQYKSRLLMELFFKQHRERRMGDDFTASAGNHHVRNGNTNHSVPFRGEEVKARDAFICDKCELPQLELRIHVKRGGILHEMAFIAKPRDNVLR